MALLLRLGLMIAGALVLCAVSQTVAALAVIGAPNLWSFSSAASAAAPPAAQELDVDVGPRSARLAAWVLSPPRVARGTVLLLHGVRMDKASLLKLGRALVVDGYRVVLVDLRGHGSSTGSVLTYGELEASDLSQVLDAVERTHGALGPTGVFGYSYGGAAAIQLAAHDPRIDAVAAASTFASLREVARDYLERLVPAGRYVPQWWLDGVVAEAGYVGGFDTERANTAEAAGRLRIPLLLFHGTRDVQVPPAHSSLILQANPNAEFVPLSGVGHANVYDLPSVGQKLVAWFGARLLLNAR